MTPLTSRLAGASRLLCAGMAAVLLAASAAGRAPTAGIGAGTGRAVRDATGTSGLPIFTVPPVLVPPPNPTVPLAATITLRTNFPTRISLVIDDGFRVFTVPDADPKLTTDHTVLVLGVLADRTNRITVVATDQLGRTVVTATPLVWTTPPLPPDFPPIRVDRSVPAEMEPGYTMIGPSWSTPGHPGGARGRFAVFLDDLGRAVWFMEDVDANGRLRNGHLLVGGNAMEEVDMLGNVVQSWFPTLLGGGPGIPPGATPINTNSLHHAFEEMPPGADSDFLFLSTEMRVYSNYPLDELHPTQKVPSANVVGDVIVEIDRDGTIVRQKRLLDILDPYRIGYDNTFGFWNSVYGRSTRDWSHANSLVYDASDDTYIVSLRHQDCIVKIRRDIPGSTPNHIVWILGNHDGWRYPWSEKLLTAVSLQPRRNALEPPRFEWQFHQHAAFVNLAGNITCFDNGNYRTSPPNPFPDPSEWYSRAVEYRIDPLTMSVGQVWAAGGLFDPQKHRLGLSTFISSTEHQPLTGNVLVNSGARSDPASGTTYVELTEFHHTSPPSPVLEITIREPDDSLSWTNFRARRLPTLYPW